jgi:hypothetical protein
MPLSAFQFQASFQFPSLSKHRSILGDGAFAILNKCGKRWTLWLYPTADEAKAQLAEWRDHGCPAGAMDCRGLHEKVLIKPDHDWIERKMREAYDKTRK